MLCRMFHTFAFTTALAACAEQPIVDELGEESPADGEAGKGDAAAAFTYYDVRPDLRACSFDSEPGCGLGFFVARANRSTTQCSRGPAMGECKVLEIDWSGTAMPASVATGYENKLRAGTPMLLRGMLVPAQDDGRSSLAVTEIWVPNAPGHIEGVFVLVRDNGVVCITAPCPSVTERRLNSNLSAEISSIDFEPSGATSADVAKARTAMASDDGLIVVGARSYDSFGGKARTANKFFMRAPVPLY